MKANTRLISIRRTVEVEVPAKDGKMEKIKVVKTFPCRVNAGVPFEHRLCENG